MPTTVELELDGATCWRIEIVAEAWWSRPLRWCGEVAESRFELLPAAELGVQLTPAPIPETDLEAVAWSSWSERGGGEPGEPVGVPCMINDARTLRCRIPAVALDVRLEVSGFAPLFFWDLHPHVGETLDLELVKTIHGESVTGWVQIPPGIAFDQVTLELSTLSLARSPAADEQRRERLLGRRIPIDSRGRFVATGLRPGRYRFSAAGEGLLSAEQTLLVEKDVEQQALPHPLVLGPPSQLELIIEPPLDAWGRPWQVELARPIDGAGRYETEVRHSASGGGVFAHQGLAPGSLWLQIVDSSGSRWWNEEIQLVSEVEQRFVSIDMIEVRGSVRWRGEGLAAEIYFGGVSGQRSIRMESDAEGSFVGHLPAEGRWPLDLRRLPPEGRLPSKALLGSQSLGIVEVERPAGRSWAKVDAELPDTRISGEVLLDGEPVAAIVLGIRPKSNSRSNEEAQQRRALVVETGKDGRFEILGLPEGELELQAMRDSRSSAWVSIDVQEKLDATEIQLELAEKQRLRGTLHDASGVVAGAHLLIIPDVGLSRQTESRSNGTFEITLQNRAQSADLATLTAEVGLALTRITLSEDPYRSQVESYGEERSAIRVIEVYPDGPAEKAGLEPEDRILAIRDETFYFAHDLDMVLWLR